MEFKEFTDGLKLGVSETTLFLLDNSSADEINWVVDNTQEIKIYSNSTGTFIVKITNKNQNTIEQIVLEPVNDNTYANYLHCYSGTSEISKILKSGSKINIGVIYYDEIKEANVSTTPLTINLKKSIGNINISPEELDNENSKIIEELIASFSKGRPVRDFRVIEKETDNNYYLEANFADSSPDDWEELGKVSASLEDLGIRNKRHSNGTGGGGQIGYKATSNSGSGFAGGYSANTKNGVAIGDQAKSVDGIGMGSGANSAEIDSIVIGLNARIVDEKKKKLDNISNSHIIIGNEARVQYENAQEGKEDFYGNIVIGKKALAHNSRNVTVIGSRSKSPENNSTGFDTSLWPGCQMPYASITNVAKNSTLIGPRSYLRNAKNSVAIGANNGVVARDYLLKYGVSIGSTNLVRESGCIAIGNTAMAGVEENGDVSPLNKKDRNDKKAIGAIAIGTQVWARRLGCIAIGRKAKSCFVNNIAIGNGAEAGNVDRVKNKKGDYYYAGGDVDYSDSNYPNGHITRNAVAIGPLAKAKAFNSIQLGKGTNLIENSLQFRNTTVVKNGKIPVDMSNKDHTGVLSVERGGTGGSTRKEALNNLGIYYGSSEIAFDDNLLNEATGNSTGGEISITFPDKLTFKTAPHVVATLRTTTETLNKINPQFHSIIITEISKTGFKIKYKYSGSETKDSIKKNFKLVIDYTVLGDKTD